MQIGALNQSYRQPIKRPWNTLNGNVCGTGRHTTGLGLTYEYFANGWLKAVKMGNDTIAEYEYDQVGNRIGINLGNGTHTVYDYDGDPRYRVSGIGHYNGQTPLGSISYPTRDGSGNPLSMIDSSGQISYDYDMNSRLIEAGAANYSYDWVGNRLVPGSAQYNAADQLTSGFGHTYNYDGRGNMIESVGANGKTFTYTPANLLESVTHAGVQDPSVMTWDGDSNRVSFSSSEGGTWQFVYDPTAGIPAVIEEVTPSGSVYYLREPNGALIARVEGENIRYYHFDALGSTRLLTDGSGALTDEYSYDAWGNVISHDQHVGSIDQPYQFVGRLGYYTHWQDPNLDLLQLGVRFYDPEIGRFTQRNSPYAFNPASDIPDLPDGVVEALKELGETACISQYCEIYPQSQYCLPCAQSDLPGNGRNPCDIKNPNVVQCQECCDIKYDCCMIMRGGGLGARKCMKEKEKCDADCFKQPAQ